MANGSPARRERKYSRGDARDIEKSKVTEKDGKEAASSNDCILAS